MNFFTTPNSKNIIATLRIVTIEKSELTFLLVLYFHGIINHRLLIAKLHVYGFSEESLKLIKSYLTNRWQRTNLNKGFSKWT